MMNRLRHLGSATLAALALVVTHEERADACGACYSNASESTVVTDHQMALAISPNQTVLWDRIAYAGNPKEFAYVVPVRPGTVLEASSEAWFAALDAATRPIIMPPPQPRYGGGGGGAYDGDGNFDADDGPGCACSRRLSSASFSSAEGAGAAADASAASGAQAPAVQVVAEDVVGPYETVTVRSEDPEALQTWLVDNGFAVPEESRPIIQDFVERGFDFIALRLRPGQDVRAMRPIRIVSPGADLNLPLRMMRIGSGAELGVTVYVLAEGRYETKSFPDGLFDDADLVWDYSQGRSNYQELSRKIMAREGGTTFLTEYADRIDSLASRAAAPGMMGSPPLDTTYTSQCFQEEWSPPLPPKDAGTDASADAGAALLEDAGTDDAGLPDAGLPDAGPPRLPPRQVKQCDDFEVALYGKQRKDVWVSRLRAVLPNQALETTLVLEPSASQTAVSNIHTAKAAGAITSRIAPRGPDRLYGAYTTTALTAFVVSRLLRRRRRASR